MVVVWHSAGKQVAAQQLVIKAESYPRYSEARVSLTAGLSLHLCSFEVLFMKLIKVHAEVLLVSIVIYYKVYHLP